MKGLRFAGPFKLGRGTAFHASLGNNESLRVICGTFMVREPCRSMTISVGAHGGGGVTRRASDLECSQAIGSLGAGGHWSEIHHTRAAHEGVRVFCAAKTDEDLQTIRRRAAGVLVN